MKYKLLLKVLSHAWKLRRSFFFMNLMKCLSNIYIWKGLCHQNGKRQRVLTLRLIPLGCKSIHTHVLQSF